MRRSKLTGLALAAVVVFAFACSSEGGGSQASIEQVRTIPFMNLDVVAGGGPSDLVGVVYTDVSNAGSFAGFRATLHLFRYDAATPDDLVDLGDTYLGVDTLYHRVEDAAVTADWIAVPIGYNEAPSGWVALVSLAGPIPVCTATVPLSPSIDRAVASGRWLLVAAGAELGVLDLADPASPVLVPETFVAAAPVTLLLPVPGGFLAFHAGGYVRVSPDPVSPTFVEAADPVIRNFKRAVADGDGALLAGPSLLAGKSRVVRVGLGAGTPEAVHSTDYDGTFVDFAFDGSETALLRTTTAAPPGTFPDDVARVLHARPGGFDVITTTLPHSYGTVPRLAARDRHLYAADVAGLSIYRLP
jgi:hypothetical protein